MKGPLYKGLRLESGGVAKRLRCVARGGGGIVRCCVREVERARGWRTTSRDSCAIFLRVEAGGMRYEV